MFYFNSSDKKALKSPRRLGLKKYLNMKEKPYFKLEIHILMKSEIFYFFLSQILLIDNWI